VRRRQALLLAPAGGLPWAPARAQQLTERLPTPAELARVGAGGLVAFMRHGLTDNSRVDQAGVDDFSRCSAQRPLSPEGLHQAETVGAAIRRARWPVRQVVSSPLCRARDSAVAAFGKAAVELDPELAYTAHMNAPQRQTALGRTRHWLSTRVAERSLRVVVAHGPNLADLTGYFPTEGTVVLFQPLGDGRFDYLGSIRPEQWVELSH
jgi:phosphohistidine phosphatase SixA